ncbi:MAG TPA: polysaccharide deacetylase family protein [Conexibacter sp.]|nr:polysaccharide deacetylase family protein [Conexibacter sp.]
MQGIRRIAIAVLLALAAGGATATAAGPGGAAPGDTPPGSTSGGGGSGGTTPTPAPTTPIAPLGSVPLHLHTATLTQDGGVLVWSLTASRPWTPATLGTAAQSLCVRLVYETQGFNSRDVCVAPSGSTLRLTYARVLRSGGHGPSHPLGGRVARPDGRSLVARFDPAKLGIPYSSVRWRTLASTSGCALASGTSCFDALPADGAVLRLRAPQPVGCTPAGPAYVTNGSRGRHVVALTFDDGPSPYTSAVLDVLRREQVHATFFVIGQQVAGGAALVKRELAEGHMVGDHTWSHPNVSGGGAFASGQITSTASAIQRATGFRPCLFRAPYGAVSSSLIGLAHGLGFTTVEWDVDPQDWSTPGSGAIYSRIVGNVHDGSIVLMHDGGGPRSQTLAALPGIIHTLKARGYGFVTVPELTGARLRFG